MKKNPAGSNIYRKKIEVSDATPAGVEPNKSKHVFFYKYITPLG
jgi:hypothetical protein